MKTLADLIWICFGLTARFDACRGIDVTEWCKWNHDPYAKSAQASSVAGIVRKETHSDLFEVVVAVHQFQQLLTVQKFQTQIFKLLQCSTSGSK